MKNKKIWTRIYLTQFRKRTPFPYDSRAATWIPLKGGFVDNTQGVEVYYPTLTHTHEGAHTQVIYKHVKYTGRAGRQKLYVNLRYRDEWSPRFSKKWRPYRNLYRQVTRDWEAYRLALVCKKGFRFLKSKLPSLVHSLLHRIESSTIFSFFPYLTALAARNVNKTVLLFRDKYDRFFKQSGRTNIPKQYVRWVAKKELKAVELTSTLRRSVQPSNTLNTTLAKRLKFASKARRVGVKRMF